MWVSKVYLCRRLVLKSNLSLWMLNHIKTLCCWIPERLQILLYCNSLLLLWGLVRLSTSPFTCVRERKMGRKSPTLTLLFCFAYQISPSAQDGIVLCHLSQAEGLVIYLVNHIPRSTDRKNWPLTWLLSCSLYPVTMIYFCWLPLSA